MKKFISWLYVRLIWVRDWVWSYQPPTVLSWSAMEKKGVKFSLVPQDLMSKYNISFRFKTPIFSSLGKQSNQAINSNYRVVAKKPCTQFNELLSLLQICFPELETFIVVSHESETINPQLTFSLSMLKGSSISNSFLLCFSIYILFCKSKACACDITSVVTMASFLSLWQSVSYSWEIQCRNNGDRKCWTQIMLWQRHG